jgi:two-component system, NarL family, nitrate/nitrite response regulator NarL
MKTPLTRAGPIRVVVADEQPLFRDALARALRQDRALEVVADVGDGAGLVRALRDRRPDVVLLDADMLVEPVVAAGGAARLLVLAADVRPAAAYRAVEAGAAGYLSKDAEGAVICRAVAAVARGETVLDPSSQTGLAREIRLRGRDERPVLSPREHEILVLIAEGRTAPEIGRRLHLSTATVKTHQIHVYEKLGVAERAAAVAWAMRRGLLE